MILAAYLQVLIKVYDSRFAILQARRHKIFWAELRKVLEQFHLKVIDRLSKLATLVP